MAETPAPSGEFLRQQVGPLPLWAWGGLGLGAAVVYSVYKKNKATATAATPSSTGVQLVGGDQTPPIVWQNYNTNFLPGPETPPSKPPGSGAPPLQATTLTSVVQESPGMIRAQWTPVGGASRYKLQVTSDKYGTETFDSGPTSQWRSAGFTPGTVYNFSVAGVDARGRVGPFSPTVPVST